MSERRCARCGRIEFAHKIPWEMDCLAFVPEERREGERRVREASPMHDRRAAFSSSDRRTPSPPAVVVPTKPEAQAEELASSRGTSAGGDTLVERLAAVVAARCDGAGCVHRPCRHCINAARRSVNIVADELAARGEHQVVEILRTEASR